MIGAFSMCSGNAYSLASCNFRERRPYPQALPFASSAQLPRHSSAHIHFPTHIHTQEEAASLFFVVVPLRAGKRQETRCTRPQEWAARDPEFKGRHIGLHSPEGDSQGPCHVQGRLLQSPSP